MEATEVTQNEHKLAQKAQGIYEHRQKDDNAPIQVFCVQYVQSKKIPEDQFQIQPLNE